MTFNSVSSFGPKYQQKNLTNSAQEWVGQNLSIFFVGILVQTMTSKGHFEINWPLRLSKKRKTTSEWVTKNMLFPNFLQWEDIFLGLFLVTTAMTTTTSPFEFSSLGVNQRLNNWANKIVTTDQFSTWTDNCHSGYSQAKTTFKKLQKLLWQQMLFSNFLQLENRFLG